MNTVVIDRAGRVVPHRVTKRGKLIRHTPVEIQRGMLRTIVRVQIRSWRRRVAGRYVW